MMLRVFELRRHNLPRVLAGRKLQVNGEEHHARAVV